MNFDAPSVRHLPHKVFYTGIGSRDIPDDIRVIMMTVGEILAERGYVLRSGGAPGADTAFENGCDRFRGQKEVFKAKDATAASIALVRPYHGAWHLCNDYARKLHGRNAFQVLGQDLKTFSKFVICYTHDGCLKHADRTIKTGGTGTAISVASERNIPVYNLRVHRAIFEKFIREAR